MIWDVARDGFRNFSYFRHASNIMAWKEAVQERIKDVQQCKSNHSQLVLQTSPSGTNAALFVMPQLNAIVRELALTYDLCLSDYDRAVHDGIGKENKTALFSDGLHPNKIMASQHAWHLLDHTQGDCMNFTEPYKMII